MARALICASHKNVNEKDTIPTATVASVASVIAPSASNQEKTIAKNEICIHFGHIPRFRTASILIKSDAIFMFFAFRLARPGMKYVFQKGEVAIAG